MLSTSSRNDENDKDKTKYTRYYQLTIKLFTLIDYSQNRKYANFQTTGQNLRLNPSIFRGTIM